MKRALEAAGKNTDDKMVSVVISTYGLLVARIKIQKFIFTISLNLLQIWKHIHNISNWESRLTR